MFYKKGKIRIALYGYVVNVIATDDMRKAMAKCEMGDLYDPDANAMHVAVAHEAVSYVFLKVHVADPDISHEAVHVGQRIVKWIGAGYTDNEFIAYLFGYVIDAITEFYRLCAEEYKSGVDKPATTMVYSQ